MNGFFQELRRRNVLRVAIAYLAAAWLIIQVTETILPLFGFDDAAARLVVVVLAIGFIPALAVAWVFEWTPEGIKRESEVDRAKSVTAQTGKRLDKAIIVVLAIAVVYFAADNFSTPSKDFVIDESTIAVLPFDNLSTDPEQAFVAAGLSEDVLNLLAGITELDVRSRQSTATIKQAKPDVKAIGESLNVAFVLDGTVRRAGNTIRISAQLIDARTDSQVWSEVFDRDYDAENLFAIQSEIASVIVEAARAELTPEQARRLSEPLTNSTAAYEAYMFARGSHRLRQIDTIEEAVNALERAIELDPDFAEAHVELAGAKDSYYWMTRENTRTPYPEFAATIEPIIRRALELDPELGDAYASLGFIEHYKGNLDEAKAYFERAFEYRIVDETIFSTYAHLLRDREEFDEAWAVLAEGLRLAPQSTYLHTASILVLVQQDRTDEAIEMGLEALEIDERVVSTYPHLSNLYFHRKARADKAIEYSYRWYLLEPENPRPASRLAWYHQALGDNESSRYWAEKTLELAPRSSFFMNLMASGFLYAGDPERARQLVNEAEQISPGHVRVRREQLNLLLWDKNFDGAVSLLRDWTPDIFAVDADIPDDQLVNALALAYASVGRGNVERSQILLNRLLDVTTADEDHCIRGVVLALQGRTEEAVAALQVELDEGLLFCLNGAELLPGAANIIRERAFERLEGDPEFERIMQAVDAAIAAQLAAVRDWKSGLSD